MIPDQFMPAFYAAVQAVDDGKAAEINVQAEWESSTGETISISVEVLREQRAPFSLMPYNQDTDG